MPERLDLVPTRRSLIQFRVGGRVGGGGAAEELGDRVDAVDGDAEAAGVVEVAEGAAARRRSIR